jgi:hypothetical protein
MIWKMVSGRWSLALIVLWTKRHIGRWLREVQAATLGVVRDPMDIRSRRFARFGLGPPSVTRRARGPIRSHNVSPHVSH